MAEKEGWSAKGAWAVCWQKEKYGIFVEQLLPHRVANYVKDVGLRPSSDGHYTTFGLSTSDESAMLKVEERLVHDPEFALRWRGGAFRPVPYHLGIWVQTNGVLKRFPLAEEL